MKNKPNDYCRRVGFQPTNNAKPQPSLRALQRNAYAISLLRRTNRMTTAVGWATHAHQQTDRFA
ncbi:MAG: hypothetical protein J6W29_09745 [Neisseriaceae bacterium]|nr:hypothetical protein [Neisseriaceae bacterium]